MNELFGQLKAIDEILEQITTITANQTTVLLQSTGENEDDDLSIIENMVSYKDELITKLVEIETLFDKSYKAKREQIKTSREIGEFKKCVASILEKKEKIQKLEKNNVTIMQTRAREIKKIIKIPKAAQEVAEAYKKQQIKP